MFRYREERRSGLSTLIHRRRTPLSRVNRLPRLHSSFLPSVANELTHGSRRSDIRLSGRERFTDLLSGRERSLTSWQGVYHDVRSRKIDKSSLHVHIIRKQLRHLFTASIVAPGGNMIQRRRNIQSDHRSRTCGTETLRACQQSQSESSCLPFSRIRPGFDTSPCKPPTYGAHARALALRVGRACRERGIHSAEYAVAGVGECVHSVSTWTFVHAVLSGLTC
ncbi:hypothetical protein C8Q74DRAFT_694927 [Fomes fomentarius]|nr:hypothetical protein C8Q74DRAFT_694927 [Fomes fomentarius]